MCEIAIEVKDVKVAYRSMKSFSIRKSFGKIRQRRDYYEALKGVSFEVPKGKIVGIIGKNGSGKSTLLRTIAGVFSPDEGTVNTFGNRLSLLAIGIGFQANLSGLENIYLSGLLLGFTEKEIKAAVFEGDTKAIFRDRREFTGSLLMQLEDAYSFLDQYNRTRSEFDGLSRIDRRDYPTQAIREALMNALVHREYALPGPILISIYDNRIEITTPGGLVNELTLDDVMLGVSILRNRNLGNVFYRLELIEAYGTGIARIMESYEPDTDKPRIDVSDNAFRITLPNRNSKSTKKKEGIVSGREQVVIDLFDDHGTISRKDIEKALGVSQATAILIARDMVDKEILLKENGGKYLRYRLNDTW